MKKEMPNISVAFIILVLILQGMPLGFSDDEPSGNDGGNNMGGTERGLEHAGQPKKDALTAWSEYFFGKPVDPLDAKSMEDYQKGKATQDKRVQAGAEFVQAASSVVSAGAPSPTLGSTVGAMAVSETAGAVVDAKTSPPPAQPSVFQRIVNWISSWFK